MRTSNVGAQVISHAEVHATVFAREEDIGGVVNVSLDVLEELSGTLVAVATHETAKRPRGMAGTDVRSQSLATLELRRAIETGDQQRLHVRPDVRGRRLSLQGLQRQWRLL